MKKLFLLFVFSLLTYTGFSQDTLTVANNDKSNAIVWRLTKELSLDKKQQDQVYTSLQKRWATVTKSKADKQPIDYDALNQKTIAALKNIFSVDQFSLYLKLREEKKKDRENSNYVFSEEDKELDI